MEKIKFITDDNKEVEFYVVEQTEINENKYLLVADSEEEEAEALILKAVEEEEKETTYEIVDDDKELDIITKVFVELLEDVEIER
ncbi:MAG TPA: DUF1292 domain-containing protein [Candidatus Dorea intestinavium]|nr:DUF1292 domain-containing protein [Candidatus Dorea intestinavium]